MKLTIENEKRMKRAFEKFMKINLKYHKAERLFQSIIKAHYTNSKLDEFIHYSDADKDELIDSIDYGYGGLTFERFNEIMLEINSENKK